MLNPRISICHRCPFCEAKQLGFAGGDARCMNDPQKRTIKQRAAEGDCERFDGVVVQAPAENLIQVTVARRQDWGPDAWKRLHTAKDADASWLRSFTANVPCGECKTHWREVLAAHPPVYGDGWFDWTVVAHNVINVKLGKPLMTVEAARSKWLDD